MKLVPFDVKDVYLTACFINPDQISSIVIESYAKDEYHVKVNVNKTFWSSRCFKTEADAEKFMNEFIAEIYAIGHGCENCSDYCCGARNEL